MEDNNQNAKERKIKEVVEEIILETSRKSEQKDSIFVHPSECEIAPETYNSLIDRHKGLPSEYFEKTNIEYDPNEVAIYNVNPKVIKRHSISEGLLTTYPTSITVNFVCDELRKKGYFVNPSFFITNTPNDDNTIYGHITFMIHRDTLNKEIDTILKHSFEVCGYHLGKTFNRLIDSYIPCVVYQFEPMFQTNIFNPKLGRYIYK